MSPRPPTSTLFPYTTLFRSDIVADAGKEHSLEKLTELSKELEQVLDHRKKLLRTTKSGKRSEEHTSELQSLRHLVCRLLLEKKKKRKKKYKRSDRDQHNTTT